MGTLIETIHISIKSILGVYPHQLLDRRGTFAYSLMDRIGSNKIIIIIKRFTFHSNKGIGYSFIFYFVDTTLLYDHEKRGISNEQILLSNKYK